MFIFFNNTKTKDGIRNYWIPVGIDSQYDPDGVALIDGLGHPPDTDEWEEPPELRGWCDPTVLGNIVYDATNAGHSITFVECDGPP